jgi:hypothetical protein
LFHVLSQPFPSLFVAAVLESVLLLLFEPAPVLLMILLAVSQALDSLLFDIHFQPVI